MKRAIYQLTEIFYKKLNYIGLLTFEIIYLLKYSTFLKSMFEQQHYQILYFSYTVL